MAEGSAGATATSTAQPSSTAKPTNGAANGAAKPPVPNSTPKVGTGTATKPPEKGETHSSQTEPGHDDAWDEAKDKGELERLMRKWSKHDQRARVKVRGEEKGIESLDDMLGVFTDAQRGRGANLVVQEAKKEVAEAQKVLALKERAAKGDLQALHELVGPQAFRGMEQIRAQQAEEQQLMSQMSDAEKLLFQRNRELEQHISERERLDAQAKAEKEQAALERHKATIKTEGDQITANILKEMNLPPEKLAAFGDLIIKEMINARDLGLNLGKDVPVAAIQGQVKEHARAIFSHAVEGMAPEQLADFLEGLAPNTLFRLAGVYARRRNGTPQGQEGQAAPQPKKPQRDPDFGTPGYFSRSIFSKK